MSQSTFRTPLTATALLVLMTACGGGGGSTEKAVSSSPAAPGSAVATVTANTGTSTSTSSSSTGTVSATEISASTAASATLATGPISSDGISGQVLAAMLDQKVGDPGPRWTPAASPAESRTGAAIENPAAPLLQVTQSLTPSNYRASTVNSPYADSTYAPLAGSSTYRLFTEVLGRWGNTDATIPYTTLVMNIGVSADAQQLTLAQTMTVQTGPTFANWNTRTGQADQAITLSADSAYTVAKSGLIPFNRPLKQWSSGEYHVQLMVLRGKNGSQAESCWNFNLPNVKRLICNGWDVPGSLPEIRPAETLNISVVDDRSTYTGESGQLYWRACQDTCTATN